MLRRHLGAVLCAFALAGPALAQAPADVIERPNWVKRPNGDDLARVLPGEAVKRGVDGRATIGCEVSAEGTLRRCTVKSEKPEGLGFGAAALTLAPLFKMTPKRINGQAVSGGTVQIPIAWDLPDGRQPGVELTTYVVKPIWIAGPTRADVLAAYPPKALAKRLAGQALIDCRVTRDGGVADCRAVSESPGGQGFGRAAASLGVRLRTALPDGAEGFARGVRIRAPVAFSPTLADPAAPEVGKAEWGRLPTAERATSLFPAKAKAAGVAAGTAVINCRVEKDGALAGCQVASETPAGLGFGQAALDLATDFRMQAWTSDGRPVDGSTVRFPVAYQE